MATKLTDNQFNQLLAQTKRHIVQNLSLLDRSTLSRALSGKIDINKECGYPQEISIEDYQDMFDREGIGTRVVTVWPDESWAVDPFIYETEEPDETEFEKELKNLISERHLLSFLDRADILSGIGRFGILLLGINDGKALSEPVEFKKGKKSKELLYLRAFSESSVEITKINNDVTSPRYGQPEEYAVKFANQDKHISATKAVAVHWSRVIHIADNRTSNEIYGVPRMKPVFNRLWDIRKTLGGASEGFWRNGFQGIAFEQMPGFDDVTITPEDRDKMKEEVRKFMAGLQREILLQGMTAKPLGGTVQDPTGLLKNEVMFIAIKSGIPLRIFIGSEESQLASSQDTKTWNKRVAKRQNKYLTAFMIRPTIDRLIDIGVLPEPKQYIVSWPNLNELTEEEKMRTAKLKTESLALYNSGGVEGLMMPRQFLTMVLGFTEAEAETIETAVVEKIEAEYGEENE